MARQIAEKRKAKLAEEKKIQAERNAWDEREKARLVKLIRDEIQPPFYLIRDELLYNGQAIAKVYLKWVTWDRGMGEHESAWRICVGNDNNHMSSEEYFRSALAEIMARYL